jgi:hypothetical protein
VTKLAGEQRISPSFSDVCKRAFLGKPIITDQLQRERLSNPVALGVLSPDAMAGYGMTKHHLTHREPGWQHKLVINLSAAILSTIVVGIFAVAKFAEGAWLVVVVFPVLVLALMRLNRQYRVEASVLEMSRIQPPELARHARHRVFVFVDSVDLAEIEALRYGKGLHADELIAVHFVLDAAHAARLQKRWEHFYRETPLRVVDCPDRLLSRAAQELVMQALNNHPGNKVTVLLPRRTFSPLVGRLLHDRTADKIARAISRIPGAPAQIVPYDIRSRIAQATRSGEKTTRAGNGADSMVDSPYQVVE